MKQKLLFFSLLTLSAVVATGIAMYFWPFHARKATVYLLRSEDDRILASPKVIQVADEADVRKLASFFPGMGRDKATIAAGLWMHHVRIAFVAADGAVLKVATNYERWATEHGDWEVRQPEQLKEYIKTLSEKYGKPSGR